MPLENLAHKPTVARMVHVKDVRFPDQPVAAIVTAVFPDTEGMKINVAAFTPNGATVPYFSIPHVGSQEEGWEGATWDWPPRA